MRNKDPLPPMISGLSAVAERYRAYVVDLWGVVHDGRQLHRGVLTTFERLRDSGATICLLSNAPRRASQVAEMLAGMGLAPKFYDHIVTSGESVFESLTDPRDEWHAGLGERYFQIGPPAHWALLQGAGRTKVDRPDLADFILNTGTDGHQTVRDHAELLSHCAALMLPMICANPDLKVMVGERTEVCAGAVAQYYEELGGEVRYHGKPHPAIYHQFIERLGLDPAAILAVGDSLKTDVAGARSSGVDAAFVAGGIHGADLNTAMGELPSPGRLRRLLAAEGIAPTFVIPGFVW